MAQLSNSNAQQGAQLPTTADIMQAINDVSISLSSKIGKLEEKIDQLDQRVDKLDQRLEQHIIQSDQKFKEIDERFDKQDELLDVIAQQVNGLQHQDEKINKITGLLLIKNVFTTEDVQQILAAH
jgi:uncharacterized coiled-coil DUF342 family protein